MKLFQKSKGILGLIIIVLIIGISLYNLVKPKGEIPKTIISPPKIITNQNILPVEKIAYGAINTNIKIYNKENPNIMYATTTYDSTKTDNRDIILFYNTVIKNNKYKYFTLIDGSKSIEFVNSSGDTLKLGNINSNFKVTNPTFIGKITDSVIHWKSASV
ncbi:hypothetical protein [uncultured Clostridium sp.]|uniref:hypothetical protein n=1 Tax=uncultured Clostridium sp. TaxID=59620 RepID=UPI002605A3C5|nr:hypothetical protein [uncultured Clostridium sp.]